MMKNTILLPVIAALAGACSKVYYISPDGMIKTTGNPDITC